MDEKKIPRVVVIGGGITGLAAALRLCELSREQGAALDVLLLEAGYKLGGSIQSIKKDGCLLEAGPDAIFTEKPWGVDFCKKLGIEEQLVGTRPQGRTSFIEFQKKLMPVPEGFYLMAPAKIWPLVKTPLFSWKGKFRALMDLFIPSKKEIRDESLGSFVRRRLGQEVLDRMAQPMVAGIYSSDPDELSLAATFPGFLEMEKSSGSVIRGLWKKMKARKEQPAQGPRYNLFATFNDGLETLVDKAAEKIQAGTIRFRVEVKEIRRNPSGSPRPYLVCGEHFEMGADAVLLATPAFQSAKFVKPIDKELSQDLSRIHYASGMVLNFIFRRQDVRHSLNGFGFVVPAVEKRAISGCTFSSVKFNNRAPSSKTVIRAYIGGKGSQHYLKMKDRDLEAIVRRELKEILGIQNRPLLTLIHRHPQSMPQYKVGHLDLVKKIEDRAGQIAGLAVAGSAYHGVGIPDCIHSGELAAEKLFSQISKPA